MSDNQLALAPQRQTSALAVMAGKYNVEPNKLLETLKNTVFRGATNDELLALVVVSNEYGLNPLTKEIYAFPAKGGGIVPVVSIDGWIRMMNDHPQFDGIEYQDGHDEQGKLISCTSIIYRKDRSHPTRVTEYLSECRRNTDPWKMEHRMLRHKATIQGARVAFGFSGITDEDEATVTPGLAGARDVTPNKPAARLSPIDPFADIVPPEKAEAEAEPTDEESQFMDFIASLDDATDAEILADRREEAMTLLSDATAAKALKAVDVKAAAIGLSWNERKGEFVA